MQKPVKVTLSDLPTSQATGQVFSTMFSDALGDLPDVVDYTDEALTYAEHVQVETGNARDKAADWAEADEDIEVETGEYSTKHHSVKAAADEATARYRAQIAATKAEEAETSELGAVAAQSNAQVAATLAGAASGFDFTGYGNGDLVAVEQDGANKVIRPLPRLSVLSPDPVALTLSSAAIDMDLSAGRMFAVTPGQAAHQISFSNVPTAAQVTIILNGAATYDFTTSPGWPGGFAPINVPAGESVVVTLVTMNGGADWLLESYQPGLPEVDPSATAGPTLPAHVFQDEAFTLGVYEFDRPGAVLADAGGKMVQWDDYRFPAGTVPFTQPVEAHRPAVTPDGLAWGNTAGTQIHMLCPQVVNFDIYEVWIVWEWERTTRTTWPDWMAFARGVNDEAIVTLRTGRNEVIPEAGSQVYKMGVQTTAWLPFTRSAFSITSNSPVPLGAFGAKGPPDYGAGIIGTVKALYAFGGPVGGGVVHLSSAQRQQLVSYIESRWPLS